MARVWLLIGRAIARKVRNASRSSDDQIKDYGAGTNWECPECHDLINNAEEWPGFPAGVKFDPSDLELIEHLAAKCGVRASKPHLFIEEFIPTLHDEKGICYAHPETLPGAKKDGSSIYFFHKISNAYATGQRKRRKIQSDSSSTKGPVRWHKTGKTKPILDSNGVHRGYKKIMVLHKSSKKRSEPNKPKWVVHQYHLGTDEDEKESEYVVSKVFYQQQKQDGHNDEYQLAKVSNALPLQTCPRTPNPNPPNPPRLQSILLDDLIGDGIVPPSVQDQGVKEEANQVSAATLPTEDEVKFSACLAGHSQADFGIEDPSLCSEMLKPYPVPHNSVKNNVPDTLTAVISDEVAEFNCAPCGIADLDNLDFDTTPDFADLQFGSQDSILDWFTAH